MSSVLITGARAPAALELARAFARAGHTVMTADTFRFTLCTGSRAVQKHFQIPAPRADLPAFGRRLRDIIQRESIDLVLPTCEEVFYLSALGIGFCDRLEKLRQLHSKWEFLELARGCGPIRIPKSSLVDGPFQIDSPEKLVFKREFSRFGSWTRIGSAAGIRPTTKERWVVQQRLSGREISGYGVAQEGRLTAWAAYLPVYRVPRGASFYFRPLPDSEALAFVKAFVARHHYTGQIGFDFIRTGEGLFVLECNPRATSGIHLLGPGLAGAFGPDPPLLLGGGPDRCLKAACVLIWPKTLSARDVLFHPQDPWPAAALPLHLGEILWRSLRGGLSLKDASTADIEWDGAPL